MTFIGKKDVLNNRITIHKFPCSALGTLHGESNSYKEFSEIDYAEQYAQQTGLELCFCTECGTQKKQENVPTEAKWAICSAPGDYNRIHFVDSECTHKSGVRILEYFNTFDDARRCVESSGLKYIPYEDCSFCKQEELRRQQATDLPGIIGRIVMEKKRIEDSALKVDKAAKTVGNLFNAITQQKQQIESKLKHFDFLQNKIAEKGFIEYLQTFNDVLNLIEEHIKEYESQIATIESTVANIKIPALQLEDDLNTMEMALD